jgi:hypothetical protein
MGPDIKSPFWLYFKGVLFLLLGLLAGGILLYEYFSLQHLVLLGICIWGFCRAYYFAFYVIQHYIDPGFRFAGLLDFLQYLRRKK